MNYSVKIDLAKLGAKVEGGKIVLPAQVAFIGKKGIYIDASIVERKTPSEYGHTHFMKYRPQAEAYKAMTEDQKNNIPIFADIAPVKYEQQQQEQQPKAPNEDLPF